MTEFDEVQIRAVAAEWKTSGHLFLALERTGVSAKWLLEQMQGPDFFAIYEEARRAVNLLYPVPLDCAQDIEVALLFYYWPTKVAALSEGITAVGQVWNASRELTLKSWCRRLKHDGPSGAIAGAVQELRDNRKVLVEDIRESLWLVDPALAARVQVALLNAPREQIGRIEPTPQPQVPKSITDGSLLRGIQ